MNASRVKRTARVVVFALAVLVAAALVGLVIACGVERWSVKVGTDAGAWQVDPTNPAWTSVSEMNTFARPSFIPAQLLCTGLPYLRLGIQLHQRASPRPGRRYGSSESLPQCGAMSRMRELPGWCRHIVF